MTTTMRKERVARGPEPAEMQYLEWRNGNYHQAVVTFRLPGERRQIIDVRDYQHAEQVYSQAVGAWGRKQVLA